MELYIYLYVSFNIKRSFIIWGIQEIMYIHIYIYESRQKVGILKRSFFGKIEVPFWRTKTVLKKRLPTRAYLKKKGAYFLSFVKRSLFATKGTFLNNKNKPIGTFFWKRDPGGSLFLFQKGTFEYKKWDLYILLIKVPLKKKQKSKRYLLNERYLLV